MPAMSLSEFADKLNEMMPVIMKHHMKTQLSDMMESKITFPQMVILNILHEKGESKMTQLANAVNVTTAAMTGVVDRLVRDGYAQRTSDENDRRVVKVNVTKKGAGLIERINKHKKAMIMDMFGKITQKEREEYLRILMHIIEHMIK